MMLRRPLAIRPCKTHQASDTECPTLNVLVAINPNRWPSIAARGAGVASLLLLGVAERSSAGAPKYFPRCVTGFFGGVEQHVPGVYRCTGELVVHVPGRGLVGEAVPSAA